MKINNKNIRYFNQIERLDDNFILKSFIGEEGKYKDKFIDEIKWLINAQNLIPNNVPKIVDYSLDKSNPWIKYHFIEFDTVHDMFINSNENYDDQYWAKLIPTIENFFKTCQKIKPNNFDLNEWAENAFLFSIKRQYLAIEKLLKDKKFTLFTENDEITINGKKYPSLKVINKFLKMIIDKKENNLVDDNILKVDKDRICLAHLDLVFGNMFFDTKTQNLISIDPRGQYLNNSIFGDIYYDFAKLYQSVYGRYDLICEDKFEIEIKNDEISYECMKLENLDKIQKHFDKLFNKFDVELIKFIESLQFITMIPAHEDNYQRQIVELCVGIQHFYEVIGNRIWKLS